MEATCWTTKDFVTFGLAGATLVIAAWTAIYTALTFRMNARTRRAEVLIGLHREFFVEARYKKFRSLLDDDSQEGRKLLEQIIRKEGAEFTDFLNYFELVAYLQKLKNLKEEDVDALLRYYLDLLQTSSEVKAYVEKKSNNFEHLQQLLNSNRKRLR